MLLVKHSYSENGERFNRIQDEDFYLENGKMVLTEKHHIKRGSCCGSGCKHCPFWPQHLKLNKELRGDIYNNNENTN